MKKNDKSESNLKKFALLAVIILAIGYAIVTTTIRVIKISPNNIGNNQNTNTTNNDDSNTDDNNTNDGRNSNNGSKGNNGSNSGYSGNKKDDSSDKDHDKIKTDFDVYYISDETSPRIISGMGTADISEDKKKAIFNFTGMTRKGDTAVVKYTIYNASSNTAANLDVRLTNSNSEYFKVEKRLEKTTLQAKEKTEVTVTIELLITPIDGEKKATITGEIIATPV